MIDYRDLDLEPLRINSRDKFIRGSYTHYPIVNENDELVGVIEEDSLDLFSEHELDLPIKFLIQQSMHPLACMMRMKELDSNALFLIENGVYLGAVTYNSLMHYFQDNNPMTEESALLTMRVPDFIFSLPELALIAESEGNKILSFQSRFKDMETIEIDMVFQTNDLKRIIGILENKGYEIINIYNETGVFDHLKARYENLMTYLNI
ncbi:MAG: hypothetical protein ACK5UE_06185 [Chitinophagales bacterium]|jgi:hypothetical protein|nr:hypothetical protein [Sphingobacteriales bacterium]